MILWVLAWAQAHQGKDGLQTYISDSCFTEQPAHPLILREHRAGSTAMSQRQQVKRDTGNKPLKLGQAAAIRTAGEAQGCC